MNTAKQDEEGRIGRRWKHALVLGLLLGGMPMPGGASETASAIRLELSVQRGYWPGHDVLVRVDLRQSDGRPVWGTWDAIVSLTTDSAAVNLSPNTLTLRNGRGSALVRITGSGDFTLTAAWGAHDASRSLRDLSDEPITDVGGVLPGSASSWSGVMRVTETVTVPANHVLTIQSNTIVLIEGVASGTGGTGLIADGVVECEGTADHPVIITTADPALNWGQIRHNSDQPSRYRHALITKGGRAPGEGHTGRGPAFRLTGSSVIFESCVLSDYQSADGTSIGKTMQASGGSDVVFDDCVLARSRMGPELSGTAVLCTNTYFMDMRGPDDDDAIYIHTQGAGQRAQLENCVVYGMDDDGIDTLGAIVDIRHCLVRDVFDKGMSINNGEARVRRCLIVDSGIGISTKTGNNGTVRTHLDHCTIRGVSRGIAAENKDGGAPDATVLYFVTNSIIHATADAQDSIYTDYDPEEIQIRYSNLGIAWPGEGNIAEAPRFEDAAAHDYRLTSDSPCIDAGDPLAPLDEDGSRSDMGYEPFVPPPPRLLNPQRSEDGAFTFDLTGFPNRTYEIEVSSDFGDWQQRMSVDLTNEISRVTDMLSSTNEILFYRARLGSLP